jgi:hypothetical protein
MPIHYERDDTNRLILAVARGAVTLADTLAVINRQVSDGAWSYKMLYDARGGTNAPTSDDLHQLVHHVGALTTKYGPRGPVALVVRDPDLIKMGERYARLGNLTALAVGLFLTIEDAQLWLADPH